MAIQYKLNGETFSMTSNGTPPAGAQIISSTPGQYINQPARAPITTVDQATAAGKADFAAGRYYTANGPVTAPTAKAPIIDAAKDLMNPPKPVKTTPPLAPMDYNAFVQSMFTPELGTDGKPPKTTAETERSTFKSQLLDSMNKLSGKSERYNELQNKYNVPAQTKQLQELNLQLAQKKGDFDKQQLTIEGQAIPMGAIVGQQNMNRRVAAAEMGAIAAVAQALQGNIALAEQTIEKSIEMEFEPIENEIKMAKINLDLNSEDLSREDKEKTQKLQLALQFREEQVEGAKLDRKQAWELSIEAAQNGAPNSIVTKMANAKTSQEALTMGSKYIGLIDRQREQRLQVGRPTGGGKTIRSGSLTITESDIGAGVSKLKGFTGSDGYVDPFKYKDMADYWASQGGLIKDFVGKYPPKNYINPEDNKLLPAYLQTSAKPSKDEDSGNPFKPKTQ